MFFSDNQYFGDVANGGNKFSKGDLNMRKVLLATTALVAMSLVLQLHNADVLILPVIMSWEYEN